MRGTMTAAILALVLGIGGVACNSDSPRAAPFDAKGDERATQGEGGTPSPSPATSPARFPNRDVTEAAQAWLEASNAAMKTLDPKPMLALSSPQCRNCQMFADYLREMKKNGGHLEGDYKEVVRGTQAPKVNGSTATVTLTVERGEWTEVSKAGAEPETVPGDTYDIKFDLTQENGTWIVTEALPMAD